MTRIGAAMPAMVAAFIAATLLPYVGGGWVSDDFVHFARLGAVGSVAELLTRPDAFGFYRPIPQLSFWLEGAAFGYVPSILRITNVALHVVVVLLAYAVARQLLTARAAVLAALAFALTPKAPTVAVLWASARPELLMSVFALISTWSWLKWQEQRGWWVVLSAVAYLLALLSKETAILLPLVLAVAVAKTTTVTQRQRVLAAGAIATMALLPLLLRLNAGALMPTSEHRQYAFDLSLYRLWRSLEVYAPRAMVSPLALIAVAAVAAAVSAGRAPLVQRLRHLDLHAVSSISIVWFIALMAPVFPIVARQELYLYLPVFGLCLLAGAIADATMGETVTGVAKAALSIYVVGFLAYQQVRHAEAQEVQRFTAALVESIRNDARLQFKTGEARFIAADSHSAELMRKGVGGYINGVTVLALPSRTFSAVVVDEAEGTSEDVISYEFARGAVTFRR